MKARRLLAFIGMTLWVIPMIAHAVTVTDAYFYEELTVYGGQPEHIYGHEEGKITIGESVDGRGFAEGVAKTSGGIPPMASIDSYLAGHDPNGINGRAIAMMTYYWTVEQVAGPPWGGMVPVIVTTSGSVSYNAVGDVGIGYLYAEAGFNWISSYGTFKADLTNDNGPFNEKSFDQTFRKFVGIGNLYNVNLTAWGEADADPGESISFSAQVDPTIIIDPNFSRANDFKVVFSEGIGAVPLPAAFWLFVSGLVGLAGLRRKFKR